MASVLVVEDTLTEAEIILGCLRKGGIDAVRVNNAEEARTSISQQKPDVIVLDVVLPGEDGFGLCRALKAKDETRNIPVIICSTKNGEMDKFWGMKQGASAYITKPVDQEELVRTVKLLAQG